MVDYINLIGSYYKPSFLQSLTETIDGQTGHNYFNQDKLTEREREMERERERETTIETTGETTGGERGHRILLKGIRGSYEQTANSNSYLWQRHVRQYHFIFKIV